MDPDSWLYLLLIFALLLFGAFFASSEIALSSVSRARIRLLTEQGDRRAKKVQYIQDHFDRAISTLLIGNNLAHILASSIATVWVVRLWGENAVAAATLILTVIVFFFAELLPKNIAKKYSERYSKAVAGPIVICMRVCTPFSFLLSKLGNYAASLSGDEADEVTEDEFHDMVETIAEESAIDDEKGELVQSALDFGERTVGDILTFRVDVEAIDDADSMEEILSFVRRVRHSRLPVYHDSIDNIVGILPCRRFIKTYLREGDKLQLSALLDEPFFVHSGTAIDDLLPAMNRRRAGLAVVTDDYGGVQGIVTMEDILEELVGEIWDEDDEVVESFRTLDDHTFEVDAALPVTDCFELLGLEEPEDEELTHKTMGGLAFSAFEMIPAQGDSFDYENLHITILEMDKQRIKTLRIVRKDGEAQ